MFWIQVQLRAGGGFRDIYCVAGGVQSFFEYERTPQGAAISQSRCDKCGLQGGDVYIALANAKEGRVEFGPTPSRPSPFTFPARFQPLSVRQFEPRSFSHTESRHHRRYFFHAKNPSLLYEKDIAGLFDGVGQVERPVPSSFPSPAMYRLFIFPYVRLSLTSYRVVCRHAVFQKRQGHDRLDDGTWLVAAGGGAVE